jgi:hypothetical protein
MITAFARVEGRPIGIIANNPKHLGGAIDRDGSDKAARFMQLCDAYDIPILMLCDTPGNMVGPEAEKTGLVRHNSRLFVIGANVTVPCSPSSCARATASARRAWRARVSWRRSSPSPGRQANSAAWASKARSSSAIATNSRQSPIPPSARRNTTKWSRAPTNAARR